MSETLSDERPIFMTRAVADSGGIMNGGPAHVGRVFVTEVIRSAMSCRACMRSVPCLNTSSIADT
jgi:hypothetical protein